MKARDVIDVFVYVVVLNLAIQYLPQVISESFSLSLLTALLLKVTLELVLLLKNQILTRLRAASTRRAKVTAGLALWVVAAGSKVVVLNLVDLLFGDAVSLGGFVSTTLLVMALLMSRAGVRRLLERWSDGRSADESGRPGGSFLRQHPRRGHPS